MPNRVTRFPAEIRFRDTTSTILSLVSEVKPQIDKGRRCHQNLIGRVPDGNPSRHQQPKDTIPTRDRVISGPRFITGARQTSRLPVGAPHPDSTDT